MKLTLNRKQQLLENLTSKERKLTDLQLQIMHITSEIACIKHELKDHNKHSELDAEMSVLRILIESLRKDATNYLDDRHNIDATKTLALLRREIRLNNEHIEQSIDITANLLTKLLKKALIIHPKDKQKQTTKDGNNYKFYEILGKRNILDAIPTNEQLELMLSSYDTYNNLPYLVPFERDFKIK